MGPRKAPSVPRDNSNFVGGRQAFRLKPDLREGLRYGGTGDGTFVAQGFSPAGGKIWVWLF